VTLIEIVMQTEKNQKFQIITDYWGYQNIPVDRLVKEAPETKSPDSPDPADSKDTPGAKSDSRLDCGNTANLSQSSTKESLTTSFK
jgi:hypothetical protein